MYKINIGFIFWPLTIEHYTTYLQQVPGGEEWEEWGQMEEFSVKVEPSASSQQTPVDDDLFHDMTPVFQKPKKVSKNFTHMLITISTRRFHE